MIQKLAAFLASLRDVILRQIRKLGKRKNVFAEFLDGAKQAAREREAARIASGTPEAFTARLRFKISGHFGVKEESRDYQLDGQTVTLRANDKGQHIFDADWLALLANFPTAEEAEEFGLRLQKALTVAGICENIGVDVGEKNLAAMQVGEALKHHFEQEGLILLNDVHGLQVYPAKETVMFMGGNVSMKLGRAPDALFQRTSGLLSAVHELQAEELVAVQLISAALISDDPLARLVLSVSAVELLAHGEGWTPKQKQMIKQFAKLARESDLPEISRSELVKAVEGIHRFSVAENCRRLLRRIGLDELIPRWTKFYGMRSGVFHGSDPATTASLGSIADEGRKLCARIVVTAISKRLSQPELVATAVYDDPPSQNQTPQTP